MKYERTEADVPRINVDDVALIFEGGGTRASYTSAVVAKLIREGVSFGHVYGTSAGASNAVNYVSWDAPRAEESFTGYVANPEHIGWARLLSRKHFFDGPWIYEGAEERYSEDDVMSFDWDMFIANPSEVHIEAFDADTGEDVIWTKTDMADASDMMKKVRASSSLPGFMEPTVIDGRTYMDGGLGSDVGIGLMPAAEEGFSRFFIVRTQPKGYRKKKQNPLVSLAMKRAFKDKPLIWQAAERRWHEYNDLCDKIEGLERIGAAHVFYPDEMPVNNRTTDVDALYSSLEMGRQQSERDFPKWMEWLAG
ncbi:MAG: patatin family protein [Eggerthellaceae bacterium]|nr:patatin family protein [Eggerthellaceae bacterium]